MLTPSYLSVRLTSTPDDLRRYTVSCSIPMKAERSIYYETMDMDCEKKIRETVEYVRHIVWNHIYGDVIEELRTLARSADRDTALILRDLAERLELPPAPETADASSAREEQP